MEIELINKKVDLSNGERYFYRECGVGNNIILFLHGNLSTSLHWDIIFEELMLNYGNGNFRCIAPDLRGHGETTYKTPIKTIRDLSEDIKLFCNAIGLTMFYLVGWSTGGAVAMRFTLDHPEMVIKLILLSTASPAGQVILKTDNQGIPLAGQCIQSRAELGWSKGTALEVDIALKNKDLVYLRNAWNQLFYRFREPEEKRQGRYVEETLKTKGYLDTVWALATFNITNQINGVIGGTGELALLKTPTLVYHGANDLIAPVMDLEPMKALPNVQFFVDPLGAHCLQVDNPSGFCSKLVEFVRSP